LTSSSDKISKIVDEMDKDVKNIKEESLRMCWFMRGGLTYTEAMNLSVQERNLISKIIKDNMETTKKSGMAFF
jgi:hypothetical protein